MAFGILEDHKLDNVPGTGLLSAKVNQVTTHDARELKRGSGKHSHIVLIPQPSDDPRDPLNWPGWKKEACFWTLVFATTLGGALTSPATAGYGLLAKKFHVSVDKIASSFSAASLGVAISTLVQNGLALKYGFRLMLLLSTFLIFVSCLWTALSLDLASIRASCVLRGFGLVGPHALVPMTIEHMFFVHERGSRALIYNIVLGVGNTLGPFIYGYVIQDLSWQLGFWFSGLAGGVCFVGVFLFVPETTYHRERVSDHTEATDVSYKKSIKERARPPATQDTEMQKPSLDAPRPQPSFFSQLKIYHGTFSDESMWKIFTKPFPFLLSPVTWFMLLSFSMPTVLFGITGICSSTIFTIAYHFTPAQIGLTHLAGLVGVVLSLLMAGPINNWTIVWMSQHNRGIYEPEYRLVFILAMLFGVFGYAGWAIGAANHMPWIGAVACITMLNVSLFVAGGAATAYLLDTHGANAVHVLSLVNSFREFVAYGATFFANGLVISRGIKTVLAILAVCQAVCLLTSVVMYVYGKRVRSFVARHPRLFHGDLPISDNPKSAAVVEDDPVH